jgi:hypothetical protein
MNPKTVTMLLVATSPDSVRVECGRCRAQHQLPAFVYALRMQNGRLLVCAICAQLGRLPDRRHHEVAIEVDRRKVPLFVRA